MKQTLGHGVKNRSLNIIYALLALIFLAVMLDKFVFPYRRLEIFAFYELYSRGSGWDDAIASIFIESPQRYADQIRVMLSVAEEKSHTEEVAITFVEYVLNEKGVKHELAMFGAKHTDPKLKCLVRKILSDEPNHRVISSSDGIEVSIMVDNVNCDDLFTQHREQQP